MVLDQMFYSEQMADEKKFQKVLCNEAALKFLLFWMAFVFLLGKVWEFWFVCKVLRTL